MLEYHRKTFAVQPDGENGMWKGELADDGGALGVLDNEMAWRQDERDQRGRKEHLND